MAGRVEKIGDCTLYLGCAEDVLPTLPDGFAACLLTDPPYAIVNEFGKQSRLDGTRSLEFSWDQATKPEDVGNVVRLALPKVVAKGSAFVFVGLDTVQPVQDAMRVARMTPKPFAWAKRCPPPACPGNWWPSAFELAIYGYRSGAWFGDLENNHRRNWLVYDSYRHGQPGKTGHPTQKPLDFVAYLVRCLCPPDGTVLDCYSGSGTTAAAAVQMGRRFIGIEKDERWFDVAVRRIRTAVESPLFDAPPAETQACMFDAETIQ